MSSLTIPSQDIVKLNAILKLHENCDDFLSKRLERWGDKTVDFNLQSRVEKLHRLLVHPIFQTPLKNPLLDRYWVWEPQDLAWYQKFKNPNSPYDGIKMAPELHPHPLAQALLLWSKQVDAKHEPVSEVSSSAVLAITIPLLDQDPDLTLVLFKHRVKQVIEEQKHYEERKAKKETRQSFTQFCEQDKKDYVLKLENTNKQAIQLVQETSARLETIEVKGQQTINSLSTKVVTQLQQLKELKTDIRQVEEKCYFQKREIAILSKAITLDTTENSKWEVFRQKMGHSFAKLLVELQEKSQQEMQQIRTEANQSKTRVQTKIQAMERDFRAQKAPIESDLQSLQLTMVSAQEFLEANTTWANSQVEQINLEREVRLEQANSSIVLGQLLVTQTNEIIQITQTTATLTAQNNHATASANQVAALIQEVATRRNNGEWALLKQSEAKLNALVSTQTTQLTKLTNAFNQEVEKEAEVVEVYEEVFEEVSVEVPKAEKKKQRTRKSVKKSKKHSLIKNVKKGVKSVKKSLGW